MTIELTDFELSVIYDALNNIEYSTDDDTILDAADEIMTKIYNLTKENV